jgi:hypothetical protein
MVDAETLKPLNDGTIYQKKTAKLTIRHTIARPLNTYEEELYKSN